MSASESPTGVSENGRFEMPYRRDFFDALPEDAFGRLTELAAQIFEAESAFVTLADDERRWFKSTASLADEGTAWATPLCRRTAGREAPLVVEDAARDERITRGPAAEEGLRFYAGAPLVTETGRAIGTFGVVDPEPRELSDAEIRQLTTLAEAAMDELERHQHARELQAAREKAQRAKAFFEATLRGVGDAVLVMGKNQRVTFCNEAAEQIFGYTREELVGASIEKLHRSRTAHEEFSEIGDKALEREDRFTGEYEMERKDGTPVATEHVVTPVEHLDPSVEAVSVVRDVTERKEREQELAAARERVELALEATQSLIFEVSFASGAVTRHGPTRHVVGIDPDRFPSYDAYIEGVVHSDDRSAFRQFYREFQDGERDAGELTYRSVASGETRWIRDQAYAYEEDGTRRIVGLAQDLTKRKEVEEDLRSTKEFYKQIFDQIPVELAVFSPGARFASVNASSVQNPERRNKIIGKTNEEYCKERNFDPAIGRRRDDAIRQAAQTRQVVEIEETLGRDEGLPLHYRRVHAPIFDRDGEVTHVAGYGINVTGQRRREERLREAKEEAEVAARFKEAMLANMSHEVRTPLSPIIGYAELLQERLGDPEAEFAEHIYEGGKRLQKTLDAMLSLSKLESGAYQLSAEHVDLARLAGEIAEEFAPKARTQGVEVETRLLKTTPGHCDENALRRVLGNLLENAIKFTPEGGRVHVRVRPEDGEAVLEVEDTGVGIAEEIQEDIFRPFKQESEGNTREYEGTGLGLAIVREFVELMDGAVELESTKGEGTCFTVRLPRHSETSASGSGGSGPLDAL